MDVHLYDNSIGDKFVLQFVLHKHVFSSFKSENSAGNSSFKSQSTDLFNFNFKSIEFVSCYRDHNFKWLEMCVICEI